MLLVLSVTGDLAKLALTGDLAKLALIGDLAGVDFEPAFAVAAAGGALALAFGDIFTKRHLGNNYGTAVGERSADAAVKSRRHDISGSLSILLVHTSKGALMKQRRVTRQLRVKLIAIIQGWSHLAHSHGRVLS
jgi:hypothetical protein